MTECSHVKANGNTCKSAAMTGSDYCYFHVASRDRIRRQRLAAEKKHAFRIPVLEDNETIQLAITDVVNAMFADRIDPKRAALALWALQTASVNIRHAQFGPMENDFQDYRPEHDPGLPEIEDETLEAELLEKKPVASVSEDEVLDHIEACAETTSHASTINAQHPSSARTQRKPARRPASKTPARAGENSSCAAPSVLPHTNLALPSSQPSPVLTHTTSRPTPRTSDLRPLIDHEGLEHEQHHSQVRTGISCDGGDHGLRSVPRTGFVERR